MLSAVCGLLVRSIEVVSKSAFKIDPIATLEAGEGEGVYLATLNLDALREYRRCETMGDAYRKPSAYRRSTFYEQDVPVFHRSDSRSDL